MTLNGRPNGSQSDAIERRREIVASLRLRGMSIRSIPEALVKAGIYNLETKEPYSIGTIHADLKYMKTEWRKNYTADIEDHQSRQFAEIQEVKRQAWQEKDGRLALQALKLEADLLGTLEPLKINITLITELVNAIENKGLKPSDVFNAMLRELAHVDR